ncbi:KCNB2 [Symbiodinium sp. CCMP2592]|nr:KCNB2 [Symbiodinium sp. CCMP2592]
MRVTHLFFLGMLPLAVGERAARQDALEAVEDDIQSRKEEHTSRGVDKWGSGGPPKPSQYCKAYPITDATKTNLNAALERRAYGSSLPADDELLDAAEKGDMTRLCALIHHWDQLADVPVKDHRRDAGKTSLPKKPNLDAGAGAYSGLGMTPLLYAVKKNNKNMLYALLAAGATVDRANSEGETPLIYAAILRNTGLFEPLLAYKARTDVQSNPAAGGKTIMHYCSDYEYSKYYEVWRKFKKTSAKDLRDSRGRTALQEAELLEGGEISMPRCAKMMGSTKV